MDNNSAESDLIRRNSNHELENHLSNNIYPIKEESERNEFNAEDLGDYIDKLNMNIEKLKQSLEDGNDFQETHRKNILSMTSTSEYYDIKQLEIYNKFKTGSLLNYSKDRIHNRAISFDPQKAFQSKYTIELIEERPSIIEFDDKLQEIHDYPNKIQEWENQNKEIKDFIAKTENERIKLQENIDQLSSDQKKNEKLLEQLFKENEVMSLFKDKLESEKNLIENERKELQKFIVTKLEEIKKRETELDESLKLKQVPGIKVNDRECCSPCKIF